MYRRLVRIELGARRSFIQDVWLPNSLVIKVIQDCVLCVQFESLENSLSEWLWDVGSLWKSTQGRSTV